MPDDRAKDVRDRDGDHGDVAGRGAAAEVRRLAVYLLPDGAVGAAGAAWLGWDAAAGRAVAQPDLPGLPQPLPALTSAPRRYGFHATIKPPMRLVPGATGGDVLDGLARIAHARAGFDLRLRVGRIGAFLAILPADGVAPLCDLAAEVVAGLDHLRAPLTAAEIARRDPATLTARQAGLLHRYGYPYVMDEFRPHLTLTDRLGADAMGTVAAIAARHFAAALDAPLRVSTLALMAEGGDGWFRLLARVPLGGQAAREPAAPPPPRP